MACSTGSRIRCLPLAALLACCESAPTPLDTQELARFEQCTDPAGRAAFDAAMVHVQAGRDSEAVPLLRKAVASCPELVRAHLQYQDAALTVGGEDEREMREYYEALAEDPLSPVALYAKGRLLPDTYSRLAALDRLLERNPSFYWAHLSQGRLYRSVRKDNQAVESFRAALGLNRSLLQAHLELAETLVDLGRYGEAARHYQSYVGGDPNDRGAKRAYLRLLIYRLYRIDEAEELLAGLLAQDPDEVDLLMDQAAVDWRRGRLQDALRAYGRVLELRPDAARAAFNIGSLYFDALATDDDGKRKYWPQAREAYHQYLELARPDDGLGYVERYLTVPYRLRAIDEFLGAVPREL